MRENKIRKIAFLSVITLCALLVSYIESIIPSPVPVPGIKLGLANIVSLYLISVKLKKEALLVLLGRIFLSAILFSNPINLIYSLSGGILALILMTLVSKLKNISILGISVTGACFHNIGQIICATVILKSPALVYYLPILLLVGILTGSLLALLSTKLFPLLSKTTKNCST